MNPEIILELKKLAQSQKLVDHAIQSCLAWLDDEESLPSGWSPAEIKCEFKSHSLCFEHSLLSYPFVVTHLRLFRNEDEVGYYKLITTLDGKVDDDYFVIEGVGSNE